MCELSRFGNECRNRDGPPVQEVTDESSSGELEVRVKSQSNDV